MEQEPRDFVVISDEVTGPAFLNLALVRIVSEISYEHCRLWFSETHSVEVHGPGAMAFAERLAARSRTLNGEPFQWSAPKSPD